MTPDMALLMARRLMRKHKVSLLWTVEVKYLEWRVMGQCNPFQFKIELNEYWIWAGTQTEIKRTIIHEIAHAKRGTNIDGEHDSKWYEIYQNLCNVNGVIP